MRHKLINKFGDDHRKRVERRNQEKMYCKRREIRRRNKRNRRMKRHKTKSNEQNKLNEINTKTSSS